MNEEKKKYISGIYNYCDRWCEKCGFTSSCLLFANESKIATFEIMNDRLPNAEEMMEEIFNIGEDDDNETSWDDYSDEEDKDDFLFEESSPEEDADEEDDENEPKHLIEDLSGEYLKLSQTIIKYIDDKFNFSSIPEENLKMPQIKKIFENFEVVAWYHAFIFVKIKRALDGKKEFLKYKDEELKEFSKHDMNGTAKVAAISIKNSIKALNELHEYLPESGVEIVKLSSLLTKTFAELEKEFPDYTKFIRPGFDDN